jgi:ketosteroid isomerase-like protein
VSEAGNIALTREFWRLWRNDGFDELLAHYADFFTEDLQWHSPVATMAGRSYVGRAGLAEHLGDLRESFTDIRADPTTITEIAPDVVRSDVVIHGEGPTSGVNVDAPLVALARLREGRIHWTWASFDVAAGERLAGALMRGEKVEA